MNGTDFTAVETWVFDLDNTIYPARFNLFDQVDVRIGVQRLLDGHVNADPDHACPWTRLRAGPKQYHRDTNCRPRSRRSETA